MASPTAEPAETPEKTPSITQNSDFMKLWVGQTLSQGGSYITWVAIPLTAIMLLNASSAEMGILGALVRLPLVTFLLFGVLVDRVRKRPILIWTDFGRALALLSLPLLYFADMLTMAAIYVVVLLLGIMGVPFQVAYRAYLPQLVRREHIADGNSKLQLTESIAQTLGPGIAAMLIKVMAAPIILLIDVVSYLASAVALLLIRRREDPPPPDDETTASVHKAIWQGFGWVMKHELIRPLAIAAAVYSFFVMGAMQSIYLLFMVRGGPGVPAEWTGAVLAAGGAGAILGAVFAVKTMLRLRIGPALLWTTVVGNGALLLVPMAVQPLWLAIAILAVSQFIVGVNSQMFFVANMTLVQSVTPPRMQGRIIATIYSLGLVPAPLGALGAGLLGEAIGLRAAVLVAVLIGSLGPMILLAMSPVSKLREIPQLEPPPEEPPTADAPPAGDAPTDAPSTGAEDGKKTDAKAEPAP